MDFVTVWIICMVLNLTWIIYIFWISGKDLYLNDLFMAVILTCSGTAGTLFGIFVFLMEHRDFLIYRRKK